MALDPQIVHLAQATTKMTVAVAGTRVLIRHLSSDTEQLKEFPNEAAAAQGFAATLQDLAKRRWALDPEQDPNPEPLPSDTALELVPDEQKNWNRVTRIKKATDVRIGGALRINGRKADVLEPDALPDIVARVQADEHETLHLVEGGGEILFAISHAATDSIKNLVVDTFYLRSSKQAGLELGDVSYVVSMLPALEYALLVGGFDAVEFESSTLKELHLLSNPMHPSVITALCKANLPELHTLSLGLSVDLEPDPEAETALLDLLASDALPALKNLSVEGHSNPDELLAQLAKSPRLASLEVLNIADEFEDDDEVTKTLNDDKDALKHLRLELDMIDELFPDLDIHEPTSRFNREDYRLKVEALVGYEPPPAAEPVDE